MLVLAELTTALQLVKPCTFLGHSVDTVKMDHRAKYIRQRSFHSKVIDRTNTQTQRHKLTANTKFRLHLYDGRRHAQ